MLSRSDIQKIHSLTIKPLLSKLPGQVCAAFGMSRLQSAVGYSSSSTVVALKYNGGGLYRL